MAQLRSRVGGREERAARVLYSADFSMRMLTVGSPWLSFEQCLQKQKAAAEALAPAEPQLMRRQSSARSLSDAGEDLHRNKKFIFLPTSSLMRLWF